MRNVKVPDEYMRHRCVQENPTGIENCAPHVRRSPLFNGLLIRHNLNFQGLVASGIQTAVVGVTATSTTITAVPAYVRRSKSSYVAGPSGAETSNSGPTRLTDDTCSRRIHKDVGHRGESRNGGHARTACTIPRGVTTEQAIKARIGSSSRTRNSRITLSNVAI